MVHGRFLLIALIAFKFNEASSSLIPPDKNIIPGTAGKTVLLKAVIVL